MDTDILNIVRDLLLSGVLLYLMNRQEARHKTESDRADARDVMMQSRVNKLQDDLIDLALAVAAVPRKGQQIPNATQVNVSMPPSSNQQQGTTINQP